jgi:hypothetical protein
VEPDIYRYRYGRALKRIGALSVPLVVFVALLALAYRTFGPGGAGLPPDQKIVQLAGWTVPLLSSSFALGFTVMAIIQLVKPQLRAAFQSRALAHWLWGEDPKVFLYTVSPFADDALLELPIEQLAAQIQAASDAELATGSASWFVKACLGKQDIENMKIETDLREPKERTRVAYIIQRRLDGLQIEVRRRWRRLLRAMSLGVSFVLCSFVMGLFGLWRENEVGTAFLTVLFSILGGFFASAARDIVAVIERFRN